MPDRIRYSRGASSLGPFLAAVSDAGLVAFEFIDRHDPLDALRLRVPDVELVEDPGGIADTIRRLAALVDDPEGDAGIAPDPRGTGFERRVWDLLREIPAGETTSYGAVAARLGSRDARDVTAAIAANAIAILIPCHRVLRKDGGIGGYRWGVGRKRALLARERHAAGRTQPAA